MARGIINLPVAKGKKELTWYVGRAVVNGTNLTSPTVQLRINRDADFIAKRLWLVQWPLASAVPALTLPAQSSVILRDGGTQRALSLLAGFNRSMIMDADPARATTAWLGLPSPFLIRNNNNLFAEIVNPGAAGTPWVGDLFLIAEGYKVYPYLPEDIARTIEAYSIPYHLNTNKVVANPNAAAVNIAGQFATITNNGEGRFLAKGFTFQAIDNAGADVTAALLPALGFNLQDSDSGTKDWIQDQTPNVQEVHCPASILTLHGTHLPFCTPRLISENGVIQVRPVFGSTAAALAYLNTAASWPVTFTLGLYGSLLPR